jgi:hypothetical protein
MDFVLLMYERDGGIKFSFRATLPHVDVARIANQLGGGGHFQAAGGFIPDITIAEGEMAVINQIRTFLGDNQAAGSAPLTVAEPGKAPEMDEPMPEAPVVSEEASEEAEDMAPELEETEPQIALESEAPAKSRPAIPMTPPQPRSTRPTRPAPFRSNKPTTPDLD